MMREEETMKHLIRYIISGFVILAIGLALGGSLFPGSVAVVSADNEGPLVDGQPQQPTPETSIPDQPAPPPDLQAAATSYTWTYAANEFHSTHSDLTYSSYGPAIYALNIPVGSFSFKLPVNLPDGSQVTSITIYVVDNSAASNMSIQFYRVNPTNSTQIELDSTTTVGLPTSSAVQPVTMTGTPITTIDKTHYSYAIRYAPLIVGNLHQMVAVQIEFIPPLGYTYLPFVER
jgi:hypothetical protein